VSEEEEEVLPVGVEVEEPPPTYPPSRPSQRREEPPPTSPLDQQHVIPIQTM
jgi:hypothetical protein